METDIQLNRFLYLYLGVFSYIVAGISAAMVRYLHVCKPYRDKEKEYFPNKKHWILTFCLSLFLLGVIITPSDPDNITVVRCYAMLAFPGFMITGIITHCTQRQKNKLSLFTRLHVSVFLTIILCVTSWFSYDFIEKHGNIVVTMTAIFGVIYTLGVATTILWLSKQIQNFYENKYSSEEYFPTSFAKEIRPKISMVIPIMWLLLLTDNPWVIGSGYFALAIAELLFLTYILDVHIDIQPAESTHNGIAQTLQDEMEETYKEEELVVASSQLAKELETFMRDEKVYLNAKLTIMDLARLLDTSVPILRATCKLHYGSFIKMVNKFRLEHAQSLMEKHPSYSKQAIAEESGFGSYRSLHRAEQMEDDECDNSY